MIIGRILINKGRFLDDPRIGETFTTKGMTTTKSGIIHFAMQYYSLPSHLGVTRRPIEKVASEILKMFDVRNGMKIHSCGCGALKDEAINKR